MGDSSLTSGFVTGFGSGWWQFAFERFTTIGSLAWREIDLILGVDDDFCKLQRTFLKIQEVVDHMEGSPLRFSGGISGSKAWQMWFENMRKLAYDVDALLDHISLHLSRDCSNNSMNAIKKDQIFSMVISSFKELMLPNQIRKMQEKLDELTKELDSLMMIENLKLDSCKTAPTRLAQFVEFYGATDFVDDESVVGRADDKAYISRWLGSDNVCERCNFSVISVVGMAGIGKTTLARLVYEDEDVCKSFSLKIWVSVSMDFDVLRIMRSMVEYATLSSCSLSDLNALQMKLRHIVKGEKFLLVLDDYWSNLHDEWDVLSSPLRFGSRGSKIIVTTRSTRTSSVVGSSEAYKLGILTREDCWNLIKQKVVVNVEPNQNLESLGEQIASKCKGLPLVAVALGNLMCLKKSEHQWRTILESELWDLTQNTSVFPVLMLSYLNLPVHLQKCFAYCSIFPRTHEFEVEELVLLWMAEGFIHPVEGRQLEDLGSEYFDDLYSRCFFQQCRNTSNEVIYKMHDLIHDMARLVSQDICFRMKYSTANCYPLFGNVCHLSLLHDDTQRMELEAPLENKRLRTFLSIGKIAPTSGEVQTYLFSNLQFLRVLGLSYVALEEVPLSIGHLTYLRYLNLSGNPLQRLPESMCKLIALQTLKLRECRHLRSLPKDTWKLSNLRHLYLDVVPSLQCMPLKFGRLTNLQTLPLFVVGKAKGKGIEELKNMDGLRGTLCIKNIDNVSNASNASEAMLNTKTCLDKLELHWTSSTRPMSQVDQQVLEKLEPPKNLKKLVIRYYCGTIYPSWLSEASRKFTSIHLYDLKYCDSLPALGQLPWLKSFTISKMPRLATIDHTLYGTGNGEIFPLLESFQLDSMSLLVDWQDVSNGAMPRLRTFKIRGCPMLTSLPRYLQVQALPDPRIRDCPNFRP